MRDSFIIGGLSSFTLGLPKVHAVVSCTLPEGSLDLICLGRAAVDLYAEQIGSDLEEAASFAKYLGGSSANVAFGSARLGLKSAMLSRVGDEQMGRFVRNTLATAGVDVRQVQTDPVRLTGLVLLGIKDENTFPLLFYRRDCADMAIDPEAMDPAFFARARALAITGTHLSTPEMAAVCRKALDLSKRGGARRVLDIDYRPVLWGLTGIADGEQRFVAATSVTEHLQSFLPDFDLVVGTEEEFHIAGGDTDTLTALRTVRETTSATLVVKRGPLGCALFPGAIPEDLQDAPHEPGYRVPVLNVLGAGDAFMSGFLSGWLRGKPLLECARNGNACGALVVSRHGCAPAMPGAVELADFQRRAGQISEPARDETLKRLHAVVGRTRQWPELLVLAFDHRAQLEQLARETGSSLDRIARLKQLIAESLLSQSGLRRLGAIVDHRFGAQALHALKETSLWVARALEAPGSWPLEFEFGDNLAAQMRTWPTHHVAKCLVHYHPDDADELRSAQERKVKLLSDACLATGHECLLEVILPRCGASTDTGVARVLRRLYSLGVKPDWWKLEPPGPNAWPHIEHAIEEGDPHCRGVLLLGLDAPAEHFAQAFTAAAGTRVCKGFAIGRTLFAEPAKLWLAGAIDDENLVARVADNYRAMIEVWDRCRRTTRQETK